MVPKAPITTGTTLVCNVPSCCTCSPDMLSSLLSSGTSCIVMILAVSQLSLSCNWCEVLDPEQPLTSFLSLSSDSPASATANSPDSYMLPMHYLPLPSLEPVSCLFSLQLFCCHIPPLFHVWFYCSHDVIALSIYILVKALFLVPYSLLYCHQTSAPFVSRHYRAYLHLTWDENHHAPSVALLL